MGSGTKRTNQSFFDFVTYKQSDNWQSSDGCSQSCFNEHWSLRRHRFLTNDDYNPHECSKCNHSNHSPWLPEKRIGVVCNISNQSIAIQNGISGAYTCAFRQFVVHPQRVCRDRESTKANECHSSDQLTTLGRSRGISTVKNRRKICTHWCEQEHPKENDRTVEGQNYVFVHGHSPPCIMVSCSIASLSWT